MKYGLAPEDREYFDQMGFLVAPNVLSKGAVRDLLDAVDEVFRDSDRSSQWGSSTLYSERHEAAKSGRKELRNAVARHPLMLELASNPTTLSLVTDLLGPNIKLRTTEVDVRPPMMRPTVINEFGRGREGAPEQWHIDGPLYSFPDVDGIVPMMEVRVGFFLTDLRGPENGALCVAAGTHKLDYRLLMDPDYRVPESCKYPVRVPAGSVVIFRTGLWHCTTPNFSELTRKVLYYAYTYRWVEPSDYIQQSPDLLARCTPLQRQLLGAPITSDRHPLGEHPDKTPCSFYWFTRPEDLPIIEWRENLNAHDKGAIRDEAQSNHPSAASPDASLPTVAAR